MNEDQLRMIFEHIPADKVKPVDDSLLESLSRKAKRSVLRTITASSNFSSSVETVKALPKFNRDEVTYGKLLGTGQFGEVVEIKRFNLKDACEGSSCNGFTKETDYILESENRDKVEKGLDGREFLATHCLRCVQGKVSARYAIKTLQVKYHKDPTCYYLGAKDLAREAHFLSSLEHPHIVKLRATAAVDLCSKNYFIILDRLYGTVRDHINEWKKRQNRNVVRKIFRYTSVSDKEAQLVMFEERLRIAFDICSALRYLHANNLIHRDVKPENVGFDVRGDPKIFDFGLAVEIPDGPGPYKLTGNTGTLSYMAPEVYYCKLYDQRCDVHSFGLLLWEMFALEKVTNVFDVKTFVKVSLEQGARPPLNPHWPEELRDIMRKCLIPDFNDRSFIEDIWDDLRQELARLQNVDPELLGDCRRRRSTYLINA